MKINSLSTLVLATILIVLPLAGCTSKADSSSSRANVEPSKITLELPVIPLDVAIDIRGKISVNARAIIKVPTPIGTFKFSPGGISLSAKDIQEIENSYKSKRILIIRVDDETTIYEIEKGKKFDITLKSDDKLYKKIRINNKPSDENETLVIELESVKTLSEKLNVKTISFCPLNTKTFVSAETNNFFVYICGVSTPTSYVGIAKSGGASIRLPLSQKYGDRLIATNGDFTYTITPQILTITQNNITVQEDSVISYKLD